MCVCQINSWVCELEDVNKKFLGGLEEIFCFTMFIQEVFPSYFDSIRTKINYQVQKILIFAYDYIKQNDEQWARCAEIVSSRSFICCCICRSCIAVAAFAVVLFAVAALLLLPLLLFYLLLLYCSCC